MGFVFSKILHDGMIEELHHLQGEKWDLAKWPHGGHCRHGIWSRNFHQQPASPSSEGIRGIHHRKSCRKTSRIPTKNIPEDLYSKAEAKAQEIFMEFFPNNKEPETNPQDETIVSMPPLHKVEVHAESEPKFHDPTEDVILEVKPTELVNPEKFDSPRCNKSILSSSKRSKSNNKKNSRVTISESCRFLPTMEVNKEGVISENNLRKIDKSTTNLIGRLKPSSSGDFVDFEYHFSRHNNKDLFKASGPMGDLVRDIGGNPQSCETEMTNFFQNLELFLNNCYGELKWNGATILAEDEPHNRLEVAEYELEPTKLYITIKGLKELHIIRSPKRLELRGLSIEGGPKWFRMMGPVVHAIGIEHADTGRICLIFPEIEH